MAVAFTTAKTWSVGDVLTAADMNLYVRDNTTWLGTDKPIVRVYHSANESIAHATTFALQMNTAQFNNQAMWASGSNKRLTCPTGMSGKYLIGGQILFAAHGTGTRAVQVRENGTTFLGTGYAPGSAGLNTVPNLATIFELSDNGASANDYVELTGYQDSGVAVNSLTSGVESPHFFAVWIST